MEKIYIHSWLNNENSAEGLILNANNDVSLDFTSVEEISLTDVERLLYLQKIAVFNQLRIHVENMRPHISKIFEDTGLYKLLTFGSPSERKIRKRQGLAFE